MKAPRNLVGVLTQRAVDEAWQAGYLAALTQVESAVYQGEEALFALLRSMPEVKA